MDGWSRKLLVVVHEVLVVDKTSPVRTYNNNTNNNKNSNNNKNNNSKSNFNNNNSNNTNNDNSSSYSNPPTIDTELGNGRSSRGLPRGRPRYFHAPTDKQ